MKTYLVTGGAGFIGSHIVARLVKEGQVKVRVLDNFCTGFRKNLSPYLENGEIELIEGDLLHPDAVSRAVDGVEIIFHEAALASVPLSVENPLKVHETCVSGTVQLLDAARKNGVRRVIYAASSSAYGDTPTTVKKETDLPAPISPYGAAKLAAELYLESFAATYHLETVRLRYFNVFGPRQDPKSPYSAVIPLFITAMKSGNSPVIFGDGQQSRDFTYVSNIVDANLLAAHAPAAEVSGKVFNIANGKSYSLLTLVDVLNKILGTHWKPIHKPPRVGDIRESRADITQAQERLKYTPRVGLMEGLAETVNDY
ncbi:MAG: SDR family oxidoreductase [Planctomycetia bacterium]|nr:SDR family oxidoreductase [Planctomycetia bacterium]